VARVGRGVVLAGLVGEHGNEPAVSGIEVEMVLVRLAEVRLLEHEAHAEQALPEVDRALAGRAHQRDVMYALNLDALHGIPRPPRAYSSRISSPTRTVPSSTTPAYTPARCFVSRTRTRITRVSAGTPSTGCVTMTQRGQPIATSITALPIATRREIHAISG